MEPLPINPINFFDIVVACKKGKEILLPDYSEINQEKVFAKVWLHCSEDGFTFRIESQVAVDSIELFIDTRGQRGAIMGKYCHHFIFSPIPFEGVHGREVTRFRTDDRHSHADSSLLTFKGKAKKMSLEIPTEALHGFDLSSAKTLGFTYRIKNEEGKWQHFTALSADYAIEYYPTVWAQLLLS